MTLRGIESLSARNQAVRNLEIQDIEKATEALRTVHFPSYLDQARMELAYLVGVVDSKRAERARRKPPIPIWIAFSKYSLIKVTKCPARRGQR